MSKAQFPVQPSKPLAPAGGTAVRWDAAPFDKAERAASAVAPVVYDGGSIATFRGYTGSTDRGVRWHLVWVSERLDEVAAAGMRGAVVAMPWGAFSTSSRPVGDVASSCPGWLGQCM
ncbi:hypothetical protein Stsp02_75820 [Streptomyces sp. NBRC 14336]|nr:hypothetical protein Stsp02_75820 [Streptomyces sp. NBRC 14336]